MLGPKVTEVPRAYWLGQQRPGEGAGLMPRGVPLELAAEAPGTRGEEEHVIQGRGHSLGPPPQPPGGGVSGLGARHAELVMLPQHAVDCARRAPREGRDLAHRQALRPVT
jgi:hypothetical protein